MKKSLKKPGRCVLFVNDSPKMAQDCLDVGLKFAESKEQYVVSHWRTRQGKKYARAKTVFKRLYRFVIAHSEVKYVIIVNCDSKTFPWLQDMVEDFCWVYGKEVEFLFYVPDEDFA